MRASHADRERTVDVLKAAFAEGRLTQSEYNDRLDLAYQSQTYGQLAGVVHDLPSGPVPVPYLVQPQAVPAAFGGYPQEYPPPYASPYAAPFARPRRTNGLAAAALVLGLGQLLTAGFTAIPALVCGHVARGQIRERGEDGDGLAVAGIVLGWIGVALWMLVILLLVSSGSGHPGPVAPYPPVPAAP